jgi:NAD(P)-dependent dehydrogenase (short-subunit alcohol dehydrogenase family)
MDIAGKVAIVTGAASGLGAATAQAFAEAGAKLALIDLDAQRLAATAGATGGDVYALDVADAEAAADAMAEIARGGPIGVLVNCAGIATPGRIVGRDGPLALHEFEKVVRVNLIGTFNMMRLAAASMQGNEPNEDGERGVIVCTASVAAFEGQIGQAAYAASKGGVMALTLPAAREFAKIGVRVCTIAPGLFATPMLLTMPQTVQESLAASVPFPSRFGKPEEYAAVVLHICANPMLNGETIRLDGALRMAPR